MPNPSAVGRNLAKALLSAKRIDQNFSRYNVFNALYPGDDKSNIQNPLRQTGLISVGEMQSADHTAFNTTYNGMTALEAFLYKMARDEVAYKEDDNILPILQQASGDFGFYRIKDVDEFVKKGTPDAQEQLLRALEPKIDHPKAAEVTAHILNTLKTKFNMTPQAIEERITYFHKFSSPSLGDRFRKFGHHIQKAVFVGDRLKNVGKAFGALFAGNKTKSILKNLDAAGLQDPVPVVQTPPKPVSSSPPQKPGKLLTEREKMAQEQGIQLLSDAQKLEAFEEARQNVTKAGKAVEIRLTERVSLKQKDFNDFKEVLAIMADLRLHLDINTGGNSERKRHIPLTVGSPEEKAVQHVIDGYRLEAITALENGKGLTDVITRLRARLDGIHHIWTSSTNTNFSSHNSALSARRAIDGITPQTTDELKALQPPKHVDKTPPPTPPGKSQIEIENEAKRIKHEQFMEALNAPQKAREAAAREAAAKEAAARAAAEQAAREAAAKEEAARRAEEARKVEVQRKADEAARDARRDASLAQAIAEVDKPRQPPPKWVRPADWPELPGPAPGRDSKVVDDLSKIPKVDTQSIQKKLEAEAEAAKVTVDKKNVSSFIDIILKVPQTTKCIIAPPGFQAVSTNVSLQIEIKNETQMKAMMEALKSLANPSDLQVKDGLIVMTIEKSELTTLMSNAEFKNKFESQFKVQLSKIEKANPLQPSIVKPPAPPEKSPQENIKDITHVRLFRQRLAEIMPGVKVNSSEDIHKQNQEVMIELQNSNKWAIEAMVKALSDKRMTVKQSSTDDKPGVLILKLSEINSLFRTTVSRIENGILMPLGLDSNLEFFKKDLLKGFNDAYDLTKIAIDMIAAHRDSQTPFLQRISKEIGEITGDNQTEREEKLDKLLQDNIIKLENIINNDSIHPDTKDQAQKAHAMFKEIQVLGDSKTPSPEKVKKDLLNRAIFKTAFDSMFGMKGNIEYKASDVVITITPNDSNIHKLEPNIASLEKLGLSIKQETMSNGDVKLSLRKSDINLAIAKNPTLSTSTEEHRKMRNGL